ALCSQYAYQRGVVVAGKTHDMNKILLAQSELKKLELITRCTTWRKLVTSKRSFLYTSLSPVFDKARQRLFFN
ncbi:MAG TPA: hypothetical protein VM935_12265, partial [Chitinophagaceae bacterium]|nr:hypothetical protein [Chitinophagaceae bacterium]